eukprot:5819413-Prymnesium_polylepis.2
MGEFPHAPKCNPPLNNTALADYEYLEAGTTDRIIHPGHLARLGIKNLRSWDWIKPIKANSSDRAPPLGKRPVPIAQAPTRLCNRSNMTSDHDAPKPPWPSGR